MRWTVLIIVSGLLASGCATAQEERTLRAPSGTQPAAATAMDEGNKLFAAHQWEAAKVQYEAAIKAQPSLAEAHYNLAMALEMLGDEKTARRHYMEAATLAPGNKVIWDSPPLRVHGLVEGAKTKGSFNSDDIRKR